MKTMIQKTSVRTRSLVGGATVAAALTFGVGTATATTVLGGGLPLPTGAPISAPLKPVPGYPSGVVSFSGPAGVFNCSNGSLTGLIGTNPTTPSVAVVYTGLTFGAPASGSCTDTFVIPFTIAGGTLVGPAAGLTTSGSGGGSITMAAPSIRLNIVAGGLPTTCTLLVDNPSATATGVFANADSSVTFNQVPVKTTATGGICGQFNKTAAVPATLSGVFAPLTSGGLPVTY